MSDDIEYKPRKTRTEKVLNAIGYLIAVVFMSAVLLGMLAAFVKFCQILKAWVL